MKHLGLFAGIGGFELAARWMGWETVAWCEWNPFCQRVLKYHFPEAEAHSDIKETEFKKYANRIDILTGGFPCQPYSTAGKRKGKEDDRHLWPEMLRAIREVSPRWVVGENVRGLTNWNGGLVFDEVQADLEAEGYEVLPFLLPACSVNAPHRRDRIWFIAHNNNRDGEKIGLQAGRKINVHGAKRKRTSSNTDSKFGCERRLHSSELQETERYTGTFNSRNDRRTWENFPTQSPVCGGNDGLSRELDSITFPKWRAESLKAYGNAIVPQVAYQIFKAIEQYETL